MTDTTNMTDFLLTIGLVEILALTAIVWYYRRKNKKKDGNP